MQQENEVFQKTQQSARIVAVAINEKKMKESGRNNNESRWKKGRIYC